MTDMEFCTVIAPRGPVALTSDGALLVLVELAFDEAQHQAGLSHGRLSQQHQLELADLVARRRAVGPLCSASPCHGTVLEMSDEEGRIWCTGGLEGGCRGWRRTSEAERGGRRCSSDLQSRRGDASLVGAGKKEDKKNRFKCCLLVNFLTLNIKVPPCWRHHVAASLERCPLWNHMNNFCPISPFKWDFSTKPRADLKALQHNKMSLEDCKTVSLICASETLPNLFFFFAVGWGQSASAWSKDRKHNSAWSRKWRLQNTL